MKGRNISGGHQFNTFLSKCGQEITSNTREESGDEE